MMENRQAFNRSAIATRTQVWRVELDSLTNRYAAFLALLDEDEQKRGARFHFDRDRESYTITRGALRLILGKYLSADPKSIQFDYTQFGKPFLKKNHRKGSGKIHFNVSHSDRFALVAITEASEIGVDIEFCKEEIEHIDLAKRFFTSQEYTTLKNLPPTERLDAFYRCWTRKEAYIKAVGKGLSIPLNSFDVSLRVSEAPKMLRIEGGNPENWRIFDIPTEKNYKGALVTDAAIEGFDICDFNWKLHTPEFH